VRNYFTITLVLYGICGALSGGSQAIAADKVNVAERGEYKKPRVRWFHQEAEVIDAVRRTNRPILVYVTSRHCGFCRKMEHETWATPPVAAAVNAGFVPFYITADAAPMLTRQLHVRAFPTTIIFSQLGTRLSTTEGYVRPGRLLKTLKDAQRRDNVQQTVDSPAQP